MTNEMNVNRFKPRNTGLYCVGNEATATYKISYSCELYPENNCNDRSAENFAALIRLAAEADLCEISNAYNLSSIQQR